MSRSNGLIERSLFHVKILYLDPFLKGWSGHSFNYAQSLSDASKEGGIPFAVYGNKGVEPEIQKRLGVIPAFDYVARSDALKSFLTHSALRWLPIQIPSCCNFLRRNFLFWREFEGITRTVGKDEATVFLPNWMGDIGIGFALGLRSFLRQEGRQAVAFLRFTPERWRLRIVARLLLLSHRSGKLRFVTDSEELARLYEDVLGVEVEVFPIPHACPGWRGVAPAKAAEGGREFSFVHPGVLSLGKGFDTLVEAMALLGPELDVMPVRWRVQCYADAVSLSHIAGASEAREKLLALAKVHPLVEPFPEPLSPEAYAQLIEGADLLLLTHRKEEYAARTSGGCVEGLALGIPMVLTDGTWLAGQARRFGAALFYQDGDSQSLAETLREAVRKLPALKEEVGIKAALCQEWHNPKRFLQLLLKKEGDASTASQKSRCD